MESKAPDLKTEKRQEGKLAYAEAERINGLFKSKGIEGYSIEPAYRSDLRLEFYDMSEKAQNSLKSEFEKSGIKVIAADEGGADIVFTPGTEFPDKVSVQIPASLSLTGLWTLVPGTSSCIIVQPYTKTFASTFPKNSEKAGPMEAALLELGYVYDSNLL